MKNNLFAILILLGLSLTSFSLSLNRHHPHPELLSVKKQEDVHMENLDVEINEEGRYANSEINQLDEPYFPDELTASVPEEVEPLKKAIVEIGEDGKFTRVEINQIDELPASIPEEVEPLENLDAEIHHDERMDNHEFDNNVFAEMEQTGPKLAEYYGQGYDIFSGNPFTSLVDEGFTGKKLFAFTYAANRKTEDQKFFYPNEVDVTSYISCSFKSTSESFTGMKKYHDELETKVEVSGGYEGEISSASFTASTAYKEMNTQTTTQRKVVVLTQAKCSLYEASLYLTQNLSSDFLASVDFAKTNNAWVDFVKDWGTHYAYSLVFGAASHRQTSFTRDTVQELKYQGIDVAVSANVAYMNAYGQVSASTSYSKTQDTYYSKSRKDIYETYVGIYPNSTNPTEWKTAIENGNPAPLEYTLKSIGNLFSTTYFGARYTSAELTALNTSFNAAVKSIAQSLSKVPGSDPVLPPMSIVESHTMVVGGEEGTWFEDESINNIYMRVAAINVFHGGRIDGISIQLYDGAYYSEPIHHGGTGGANETFRIDRNTRIKKVVTWSSSDYTVNGLQFITVNGYNSKFFGKAEGEKIDIYVDGYIIGLKGKAGRYLDAIGFISNNINYDPSTPIYATYCTKYYGGTGGGHFYNVLAADTTTSVKQVKVGSSGTLNAIQLVFKNGSTTPQVGSGGNAATYTPSGKITRIAVRAGARIDAVEFYSGVWSTRYGGGGGTNYNLDVPANGNLVGVYGRSGGSIDRIGFCFAVKG